MATLWPRINAVLLMLVLGALITLIAMLATGAQGGPLDPQGTPEPTDSVRLPGTPLNGPATISVPGHYYLTRDITLIGSGVAIQINASDVSLDLGGFTVRGDDSLSSFGISIQAGQSDATIRNGTIRDFQFGFESASADRINIHDLRAVSNVRGIQIGGRTLLADCAAIANSETGIYVPGSNSAVRDCMSVNNLSDGIAVAGNANLIEGNRSTGNSNEDIRDTGTIFNTFRGNVAGDIVLDLNGAALVVDNVCWGAISNPGGNQVGVNPFC